MLRAVWEGIAFNHRIHVDYLKDGFAISAARLTGGVSRSPAFAQMFANVLGMPVTVTDTDEAAAWGLHFALARGRCLCRCLQRSARSRRHRPHL